MSRELKMYRVVVETQTPTVVRVYAVSKTQAYALFRDAYVRCDEATALQIEVMVKADVPVIGAPSEGDQRQRVPEIE